MHRKPRLPVYGTEMFAEVVRQTSASLGRTEQRVPACGQGTGMGAGKREPKGGSSCRVGRGSGSSISSSACWHGAEGGALQLEELGSCE